MKARRSRARRTVRIDVVWGSITETPGDVHVVGHYQGVLPQNAELFLDKAISPHPKELIITDLTNRGIIRGDLGDVTFIPWTGRRVVAVAGMGAPGTFARTQLRKLVASFVSTVGRLADRGAVTSVLIGSGAGNMTIVDCVQGYLDGVADAFEVYPSLGVTRIRLVELNLDRAVMILGALEEQAVKASTRAVRFRVGSTLVEAPGRRVPIEFNYSMLLAAVAKQSATKSPAAIQRWLKALLDELPLPENAKDVVTALRGHAAGQRDLKRLALAFPIGAPATDAPAVVPARLVFAFDGRHVRTSAITETATVSEREVPVRQQLFDELVLWLTRSNGASLEEFESLARFAYKRLLHPDLDAKLREERTLIVELNRSIAALPFEMLMADGTNEPFSIRVPLARQLRTSYSPPPVSAPERRITRALVIGDPGEGAHALPQCREEARRVRDILVKARIETTLLVGSPRDVSERPPKSEPAGIVAVQKHLFDGVDLVHYAGHGVYTPDRPDLSGWVFGGGNILSADDLRQMRRAPLLVMANACLSSQLSDRRGEPGRPRDSARVRARIAQQTSDAGLIAGLADEFFKQGVRDFIGAAFAVPDTRALQFALKFYEGLLSRDRRVSMGEAVRGARKTLYREWRNSSQRTRSASVNPSPTWAAYQHYGDPTRGFGR